MAGAWLWAQRCVHPDCLACDSGHQAEAKGHSQSSSFPGAPGQAHLQCPCPVGGADMAPREVWKLVLFHDLTMGCHSFNGLGGCPVEQGRR